MFPYDQFPEQVSSTETKQSASSYQQKNGNSGFFEGRHVTHIIRENNCGTFATSNLCFGSSKYVSKKSNASFYEGSAAQRAFSRNSA